jgi:hypothetical protein
VTDAERNEPDADDNQGEDTGCTRCDGRLIFAGKKDFHEGTRAWGFILGDLGELFTGGEEMAMFVCENCGHVEFFVPMKK